MSTIISHFYNEEYLLPWWLAHHVSLFDHGILINRGSTDRSVEVCRQLAPHWRIYDSQVPDFDPIEVDREVMELEKLCPGWKMVLNTTEFLCVPNKEQFFSSIEAAGDWMFNIRIIQMTDPLNLNYPDPSYALPLVMQRHHGIFPHNPNELFNGRYIHKYDHGGYTPGRHWSPRPHRVYLSPAFVLKFAFSPWNDELRKRKLQIGPTLSTSGIMLGLGVFHLRTAEKLEEEYQQYAKLTEDLRFIPEYQQLHLTFP